MTSKYAWQSFFAEKYPDLVGVKLPTPKMRNLSSEVFKKLPPTEQEHWKKLSNEKHAVGQAAGRIVDIMERKRCVFIHYI